MRNIVIYCYSGAGYGDLLFGLKTAKALIATGKSVYLIMPEVDLRSVHRLDGGLEFPVPISTAQYKILNKQKPIDVEYYIEGPLPSNQSSDSKDKSLIVEQLQLPRLTPILMLSEYAGDKIDGQYLNFQRLIDELSKKGYRNTQLKFTGLDNHNFGIHLDQELINATSSSLEEEKQLHIREQNWKQISRNLKSILLPDEKNIEDYHLKTEMVVFYSAKPQTIQDFLKVYKNLIKNSRKQHQLICIGHEFSIISAQLRDNPDLKQLASSAQFKIKLVNHDADNKEEELISIEGESKSELLIVCTKCVPHFQMKALMVLATWLAMTGDQSFSEAFSAGKLLFYEHMQHKSGLNAQLTQMLRRYSTMPKVLDLIEFLFYEPAAFAESAKGSVLPITRPGRIMSTMTPITEEICQNVAEEAVMSEFKRVMSEVRNQININLAQNICALIHNPICVDQKIRNFNQKQIPQISSVDFLRSIFKKTSLKHEPSPAPDKSGIVFAIPLSPLPKPKKSLKSPRRDISKVDSLSLLAASQDSIWRQASIPSPLLAGEHSKMFVDPKVDPDIDGVPIDDLAPPTPEPSKLAKVSAKGMSKEIAQMIVGEHFELRDEASISVEKLEISSEGVSSESEAGRTKLAVTF